MNSRLKTDKGIYLITPDQPDTGLLCAQVDRLLQQPIALLQYRNKAANSILQREQAAALLKLCQNANVPLIINDDWQLAKNIGANGVHLGAEDANPDWVREQLGANMLIGVSCYNSFERAQTMAKLDIDYLAFGAMFTSSTKPTAKRAELSLLTQAKTLNKAIVAIGGISPDNSASALDAGADYIAVISSVFSSKNPEHIIQLFLNSFKKAKP
jgi:thiamine-phosphate pyrophosphorylase